MRKVSDADDDDKKKEGTEGRHRSRENDQPANTSEPVRRRNVPLPFEVRQDFFKNIIKDAELTNKRIRKTEEEKATRLLQSRFGNDLMVRQV